MDVYTANQLQALVNAAYQRGFQDGRLRLDDHPTPPLLSELISHSPKGGLINLAPANGSASC